MSIVVLEEGNERCSDRGNLLRSHVHKDHVGGGHNRIVGILTAFHLLQNEGAIGIQRGITLTDDFAFFFFGTEVNNVVVVEVDLRIGHIAIRCLDEAELVDLCIDAKRRNQADVRTVRRLDRTEATIVGIVHVAHFETCALAAQTARTQG